MLLLPGMFFLGFEDPVFSSLTEIGPKWGPNCVRASYKNIISTIGTPFWLDWDQEGLKTQGEPSKMALTWFTVQADHVLAHTCIF